jgi:hypothetical protein
MRSKIDIWTPVIVLIILTGIFGFIVRTDNSIINGAWKLQTGQVEQILILNDGYFMQTTFDKKNKKFIESRGGVYNFSGNDLTTNIEFNTQNKGQIGQQIKYNFSVANNKLSTDLSGRKTSLDTC